MTGAGQTCQCSGTSQVTTLLALILAPSPTVIWPSTAAWGATYTPSPITRAP